MFYQRSLEIERRLDAVLSLVRLGNYSTPRIAAELQISVPTVSRAICALKDRGFNIRAEKHPNGWRYVLDDPAATHPARDAVETRR